MKLTSLLLGDFADLFQDSRIEEAKLAASAAGSKASYNGTQIARLAGTVEQRLREIERDNAVLGMILLSLLRKIADKDPALIGEALAEVHSLLAQGPPPTNLDFLAQALELPIVRKTPIVNYARPVTPPPRRPGSRQA